MNGNLYVVVMIVCGVAGYAMVSWLFNRSRGQRQLKSPALPPVQVAEGSENWARGLLGVRETDGIETIQAHYSDLTRRLEARRREPLSDDVKRLVEERLRQLRRALEILLMTHQRR